MHAEPLHRKHFARSTLRGPDAAPDAAFYGGRHGHPGDRHRRQHSGVYFIENILLRSFAVPDPEQVDSLSWGNTANTSYPNYVDFRDRNTAYSDLVAYRFVAANLSVQPRENFRVWGYEATGNYFQTLSVPPFLGRFFGPQEDDKPGGHPVIVISYRCWQSRFAANPKVIGRSVKINGYPFTIIGVAAPSFAGTELIVAADYLGSDEHGTPDRAWQRMGAVAHFAERLGAGPPETRGFRAQAEANMNQIGDQLARAYPDDIAGKANFHVSRPGLIGQELRGPI